MIGPGTGLGVAGLLPVQGIWYPIPSEGGHVSLAPHDERDAAVLACLQRRFGHVSNERVLSGPGLVNLATALAALEGETLVIDDPHEVSRRAASGECRFCQEALQRFSSLLGAAAGDLALMFCALGGVYIGGGLVKRLGGLFDVERFRASFVAKGRFVDYPEPDSDLSGDPARPRSAGRGVLSAPRARRGHAVRWPANPFWDYAVELYRKQGVEAACLELQRRHGVDVNLVLLCCWLGQPRRRAPTRRSWPGIAEVAEVWQDEVVRPLRARAQPAQVRADDAAAGQRRRALAGARRRAAPARPGARDRRRTPRTAPARRAHGRARARVRHLVLRSRAPISPATGALDRRTGLRSPPSCRRLSLTFRRARSRPRWAGSNAAARVGDPCRRSDASLQRRRAVKRGFDQSPGAIDHGSQQDRAHRRRPDRRHARAAGRAEGARRRRPVRHRRGDARGQGARSGRSRRRSRASTPRSPAPTTTPRRSPAPTW